MAVVSFEPYQKLTASDLNLAFSDCISLSNTRPQELVGHLDLPSLNASINVTTQQLLVTGDAVFAGDSALTLPVGSTFTRPSQTTFGMLRANSDAGTIEVMLASGRWASLVTTAAPITPQSPPVNMAGPSFGAATSTAIPVSWSNPSGGTAPFQFTVQYRLTGTATWTTWITDTAALSTTVSSLLTAARYEFQITASNGAGSVTSPIAATNTLGFLSGGPSNVVASSPTSTTLALNWLPVQSDNPVAYHVEYAAQGATAWSQFDDGNMNTSTTVTGLASNTTYNFQVIAKTLGASYTSLAATGVTTAAAVQAPNGPTSLTLTSISNAGFTLGWTQPSAGTVPLAYAVQLQLSGTGTWVQYGDVTTATSMVLTNLNSGSGYSVRVQAINSAGYAYSAVSNVTTLPAVATTNTVAGNQTSGWNYPIIDGPMAASVLVNTALPIAGVNVLDPPAAYSPGSMLLKVSCSSGLVTMTDANGHQITGSGTNIITYSGTLGSIQAALRSLVYTSGGAANSDNIAIALTDQLIQTSSMAISTAITTSSGSPAPPPTPNPPPPANVTATGQPTDTSGTRASRVADFLGGIGVVVRLSDPGYNQGYTLLQASVLENMINYLGSGQINYLRDQIGPDLNPTFHTQIAQNCGAAKYVLALDAMLSPNAYTWQNVLNTFQTFATQNPQFTAAFQGVINADEVNDLASAVQFQPTVYGTAHSLALPAWQMTPHVEAYFSLLGNPPADIATSVCYPPYGPNGPALPNTLIVGNNGYLAQVIANARSVTPNLPVAITECGWNSFPVGQSNSVTGWVDENVQATYLLQYLLSAYKLGAKYYFINELLDVQIDLARIEDVGQAYGLFNLYGVQKQSGVALRNVFSYLGDTMFTARSFTTGYLNYTVTNKPQPYNGYINTGYQDVVLQAASGVYYIAMWNEQVLNTIGGNNAPINVPPVNVNVSFGSAKSQVVVFDTFQGIVQSNSAISNLTVSLPTHPIILKVVF